MCCFSSSLSVDDHNTIVFVNVYTTLLVVNYYFAYSFTGKLLARFPTLEHNESSDESRKLAIVQLVTHLSIYSDQM